MARESRTTLELLDRRLSQIQAVSGPALRPIADAGGSDEIDGLLETAMQVHRALWPAHPGREFSSTARARFMHGLRAQSRQVGRGRVPILPLRLRSIPVVLSVLLVAVFLAGTVGIVNASAASLPGDALHPVKRGWEAVRLAVTLSAEGDAELLAAFSDERVREMERLYELGRMGDLEAVSEAYLATVDRLLALSDELQAADGAPGEELEARLVRHVETLLRVQAQVPEQAKPALQRVIERALDREGEAEEVPDRPGNDPETRWEEREDRQQQREDEKDLHQAEQIAKKYGVGVGQVLSLFHGACGEDWKCVRETYRELDT